MTRKVLIALDSAGSEDALALGDAFATALDAQPLTATFVHESPVRALHELIDDEHPLVAVFGPTRRGPIGRLLSGSTAASVVHGASCAVAAAPSGYAQRGGGRFLRIGVALDHGPEARSALDVATALARRGNARLVLLHVLEPVGARNGAGYSVSSAGAYALAVNDEHERVLADATDWIGEDLPFERRGLRGPVAATLAGVTEDLDLMVMGSRGYGAARRVLLGSVSARVIEQSACPVLVIPRDAGADSLGFIAGEAEVAMEAQAS